ncbi:MAG: hypothetical protein ACTHKB_01530, partial [Burkholderiaceae bacterium]
GDMMVFLQRPISATFIGICALLVLVQVGFYLRGRLRARQPITDTASYDVRGTVAGETLPNCPTPVADDA